MLPAPFFSTPMKSYFLIPLFTLTCTFWGCSSTPVVVPDVASVSTADLQTMISSTATGTPLGPKELASVKSTVEKLKMSSQKSLGEDLAGDVTRLEQANGDAAQIQTIAEEMMKKLRK